jgi:hypothetical protein
VVFTRVIHRWKQKLCFLDEFDGDWDLSLQAREKGEAISQMQLMWKIVV